jgi:anaerobic selenocysteine-containing dehydrogenase
MFNFVRLSDGGPARHVGPRSEVQLVAELGRRLLGTAGAIDWDQMAQTGNIRQAIAKIIPGWEKVSQIDQTKQEFEITGRRISEPRFPTADGRASLHVHPLPSLSGTGGQLRLMTVRSEGQFNTVVYEDYDLYRGQERRDVVLVHPTDLARLGLKGGQRIVVRSEIGALSSIIAVAYEKIRPGNVLMYYPEANVLVPRHLDPLSRTPAFKNVLVTLEAMPMADRQSVPAHGYGGVYTPEAAAGPSSRDQMRAC